MIDLFCPNCKAHRKLSEFQDPDPAKDPVPLCCHNHLANAAKQLYVAAAMSCMIQYRQVNREMADTLANECVVSNNPELRAAAIKWRNQRTKP